MLRFGQLVAHVVLAGLFCALTLGAAAPRMAEHEVEEQRAVALRVEQARTNLPRPVVTEPQQQQGGRFQVTCRLRRTADPIPHNRLNPVNGFGGPLVC